MAVLDRFLRYVSYDTQSDENSETSPSTEKQLELLKLLEKELKELGITVKVTDHGYVFGTLPSNVGSNVKIAFIAHTDTSPAASGENVKPQIIRYTGGEVKLSDEVVFLEKSFPEINAYVGQDIVFTDGTTLLGADDKAGVAEIMSMLEYFVNNPHIPRPEIKVAFTYDEEVGRGTEHFNVSEFGADFGYTVDGGVIGEISYENFNAASGVLTVKGLSVHPGEAYGKMINAVDAFDYFHSLLPENERPVSTKDHEGFYMIDEVKGDLENLTAKYIIRDHDKEKFQAKKAYFEKCAEETNKKFGVGVASVKVKDSYYNMKEILSEYMHLVKTAENAFKKEGVKPLILPIRGGTDGAHLSFEGLPCPNLSTGGHNFHGRFEYIPVPSLEKMVKVLVDIASSYALWK
ncbi:MAG: peptidase T [Clostridia bacterium]|nr:peptidase T [Clostridia bacterium]